MAFAHFVGAVLGLADARAASNVLQYTRDAAGNIVAIQRVNPSPIVIGAFTPTSGTPGTAVSITGSGFSATPAANAVLFNGATASVTAATASALTVMVPTGAATGKIVVTVGGNSATSAQDFTVTAAGAPTITAFAPAVGAAGTLVNVSGTNFNPIAGATTVKLNQSAVTLTSVTPAQLAFPVPPATGSGKLRIATSAGAAVSAVDFIVPAPGVAAADIVASTRLIANGPAQTLSVLALDKSGVILFDGSAGDWVSIQFANFAINPAGARLSYAIYKPDNTQLASGFVSVASQTIHAPQLPAAGTYAVLLKSGATQVSLDARLETNRTVAGDGTTIGVSSGAGQSTRTLFAGVAGEQKALSIAGVVTDPTGVALGYQVGLPGGSTLRNGTSLALGDTLLLPLPATGVHTLVLSPTSSVNRASYQLAFLPGVALPIDGAAQSVVNTVAGAGSRLNFVAAAGDNLGLGITGPASNPTPSMNVTVSIYKPDGTPYASTGCYTGGTQCAANLTNIPVTGSYTVIVRPVADATGTLRLWLSRDVTGALTIGTPTSLALDRPGRNARLTFPGAAGQALRLEWSGVAIVGATSPAYAYVYLPDGSTLGTASFANGATGGVNLPTLPATGTYTIFVDPPVAATMSVNLTLSGR